MKTKVIWVVKILLCLLFLAAGGAKLMGQERMVHVFELIGFGQWFRILTGTIEVTAAIALLVPRLAGLAAAGLACTMIGAIGAQATRVHESPALAIVLLLLTAFVAWQSLKDQMSNGMKKR